MLLGRISHGLLRCLKLHNLCVKLSCTMLLKSKIHLRHMPMTHYHMLYSRQPAYFFQQRAAPFARMESARSSRRRQAARCRTPSCGARRVRDQKGKDDGRTRRMSRERTLALYSYAHRLRRTPPVAVADSARTRCTIGRLTHGQQGRGKRKAPRNRGGSIVKY